MNTTVFSENLKKFRLAKNMTQEEVAEKLSVNAQTVSRWECATTLPDVMTLPLIAKLYCITVDDLYKKHSVAYDNYAQRLSSVYEKTRDPEDFLRCALEYKKLMKSGELSIADKWNYATIHHFMSRHCTAVALEWYDKAIADGPESDFHIYSRARALRADLMNELGKIDTVIEEQINRCKQNPDDANEWEFLVEAYLIARDYEKAFDVYKEAILRFPESWRLCFYGGEIYEHRGEYDVALGCYDKAGELGTCFYDEYYAKASLYNDIGEYEKAYETYTELSEKLLGDGYDEEAEMAKNEANNIKPRLTDLK
ncbi:MAG: helix-turn-helix domain-containing protein [Clostridia bacterium]|nr:helix-turn-helix domain-containing protein [Clostridia bacterium]